jgi:hypothetical protein
VSFEEPAASSSNSRYPAIHPAMSSTVHLLSLSSHSTHSETNPNTHPPPLTNDKISQDALSEVRVSLHLYAAHRPTHPEASGWDPLTPSQTRQVGGPTLAPHRLISKFPILPLANRDADVPGARCMALSCRCRDGGWDEGSTIDDRWTYTQMPQTKTGFFQGYRMI